MSYGNITKMLPVLVEVFVARFFMIFIQFSKTDKTALLVVENFLYLSNFFVSNEFAVTGLMGISFITKVTFNLLHISCVETFESRTI